MGTVISYVLALVAAVLFVAAWFHLGEASYAAFYATCACFLLVAGIWLEVCS